MWIGVSLLLVPGLLAARRALLVVSFLNPVAWLDTVLVIGMVGAAWLGGVALALVGYGVLHQFAVAPKPEVLQPGQMAGFVGRTMVASLAFYGQYVWPVLCLAAALVSFFRRQARGPGG